MLRGGEVDAGECPSADSMPKQAHPILFRLLAPPSPPLPPTHPAHTRPLCVRPSCPHVTDPLSAHLYLYPVFQR